MTYPPGTAAAAGLAACHICGRLAPADATACRRCGARVHVRKPDSLQRATALLLTAIVLLVPANLLPIMHTEQLGRVIDSTILGGVVLLIEHGSYPIALVIFVASVLVPIGKILMLTWLCWSVYRAHPTGAHERGRMYRVTELIGRWSMIDVFVVAILVALVQLGGVLTIRPGGAGLAFAGVVIATMLAAAAFDPRLIWDRVPEGEETHG